MATPKTGKVRARRPERRAWVAAAVLAALAALALPSLAGAQALSLNSAPAQGGGTTFSVPIQTLRRSA